MPTSASRPLLAYGAALAMVAAASAVAVLVDAATRLPDVSLLFVLPVVVTAVSFGWRPALVAAVAAVLADNFFLIEPRYTLRVADPANVWALVLQLTIAALVSAVAAQSRRRALAARRAAEQEHALHGFARAIAGAVGAPAIAAAAAKALQSLDGAPAVVQVAEGEALRPAAVAGGASPSPADLEAAEWALAARLPTRGGAYPVGAAAFDFWPVLSRRRRGAVLGVRISGLDEGRPSAPVHLIEIVAGYVAVALDREAYAAEAVEARIQVEGERMKADLLAAVSHDLKTPLSTILFSLQSLQRFDDAYDAATRAELLAAAETETAKLSAMVVNLLDVNRLEAGALVVRTEPVRLTELAAAALTRASLGGHTVDNGVDEADRTLMVDPALVETALVNVLENAAKYAPDGAKIALRAGGDERQGWIEVLDEGPGFAGAIEPLFAKFARGVDGDGRPPGTGLGLAIARGFMEAQGGRVEAGNRAEGGAWVRLSAPLAQTEDAGR
jgi:two-component system sensor histidine kinase KdpD